MTKDNRNETLMISRETLGYAILEALNANPNRLVWLEMLSSADTLSDETAMMFRNQLFTELSEKFPVRLLGELTTLNLQSLDDLLADLYQFVEHAGFDRELAGRIVNHRHALARLLDPDAPMYRIGYRVGPPEENEIRYLDGEFPKAEAEQRVAAMRHIDAKPGLRGAQIDSDYFCEPVPTVNRYLEPVMHLLFTRKETACGLPETGTLYCDDTVRDVAALDRVRGAMVSTAYPLCGRCDRAAQKKFGAKA